MFVSIYRYFFGRKPVAFESSFDFDESIHRLRLATGRQSRAPFGWHLCGTVTEGRVQLIRLTLFRQSGFNVEFKGRFKIINDKTVLTGHFVLSPRARFCVAIWFIFAAVVTFLIVAYVLITYIRFNRALAPKDIHDLSAIFLTVVGGIAFAFISRWLARNDEPFISNKIRQALQAQK